MFPSNVEDDPKLREKVEVFIDRVHAGKLIAERLGYYLGKGESTIVVAIPSGGVPVGYSISKQLRIPLDVILARKVPIPWEPEAGFGSVTFDGSTFLNVALVQKLCLSKGEIDECISIAKKTLRERTKKFMSVRNEGLLMGVEGKEVILVDDGLASGYTMLASVDSIRKRKPSKIIVSVPTGSLNAVNLVSRAVDKLLCLNVRSGYSFAVADAYKEWHDVPEEDALKLFDESSTTVA